MNVGVNLLWLRPGVVGGSEEYLCRQLAGLLELAPEHREGVELFTLPAFAAAHPDLAGAYRVEAAPVSGANRAVRVALESTWLARRTERFDLVHHGGGTVPAVRPPRPIVLTIHDLQYRRYPGTFSAVKRAWLRRSVPAAARRAAVIVVPSEYVRSTVVDAFSITAERVVVAPHGLPAPLEGGAGPTPEADLRRRYGLTGRVVVYPAITHRHKNHVVLVRALAELGTSHADVQLVLLGGRGPAEGSLGEQVARLGLRDRVVRPGRVPDADRDGLYAMASVLAFPSRYEGFGAPVLEAMAAGLPVVAAAAAALPEVVDGAGLLVPPDEPEAWAEALALVLDDEQEAELLRAAGRSRAATFTATRSAAALVHAYGLAVL